MQKSSKVQVDNWTSHNKDSEVNVTALAQALDTGNVDVAVHWLQVLVMTRDQSTKRRKTLEISRGRRLKTLRDAVNQMLGDFDNQKEEDGLILRPGLAPRSVNASCELSYSQLQMFALQRLQPSSTTYNVVRALQSSDVPFDLAALKDTCDTLMAKHEALRTCFDGDTNAGGQERQVVHPLSHFQDELGVFSVIPCEMLASIGKENENNTELAAFVATTIDNAFDLAHQAPIRVFAFTSPDRTITSPWILAVVLHHIVTDAAFSQILWSDLHQLYAHFLFSNDAETTTPEFIQQLETNASSAARLTYRDFSVWQRSRMRSRITAPLLQYWLQVLADDSVPELLNFPFDAERSDGIDHEMNDEPAALKATTTRGDVVVFRTSSALQKAFSELCHALGASMFMGLLAVFYLLVERLSGQQDFIIGAPSSGRESTQLQDIIGYFVNTLPLRIGATCTGSEDFKGFLASVRKVVLGAYNHSEIPFHQVLEHLRASSRSGSETDRVDVRRWQHPLFQIMFSWEKCDNDPSTNKYVEMTLPHQSAKFDLMLSMRYRHLTGATADRVLEGLMEYPTARFTRDTVERFTGYYLRLLEQVTTIPTAVVRSPTISMLSDLERIQLVFKWGTPKPHLVRNASEIPKPEFIDECLFSQVQKTPRNTALHFEGTQWTYQDLWNYSGHIRDALCMLDIPGKSTQLHTGLLLDRGMENVAAMIGILRLNAVFVPLDPEYPRERLRFMARDSGLQVIITQRKHEKIATYISERDSEHGDNFSQHILCYEDVAFMLKAFARDHGHLNKDTQLLARKPRNSHTAMAYILYTSGSTGNSKGVVVSHAALMTTLRWTVRTYAVTQSDVFLQSTSTTLDGSLSQLFSPLLVGGSTRITRLNGLHELQYMRNVLINEPHVTFCVFVPSYFALLVDFLSDQGGSFPASIKHVVLSGEIFPVELARQFYMKFKESTTCLANEYGPTEASITSTAFQLPRELALQRNASILRGLQSVPIGKPIDDHPVIVLDTQRRLVPVNVHGELYIGGAGVARGYWNRPNLTENAFILHKDLEQIAPLAQSCEWRWYKTGDLVKWLPSGDLLFLGRTDAQVKYHGMRIELQEVRSVLLRHSILKAAEVLAISQLKPPGRKRQQNSLTLVAFVMLADDLDNQINGEEISQKLLSAGEHTHDTSNETAITVQLATDILRQVWMQALGIDRLDDNKDIDIDQREKRLMSQSFFELGGDSLTAIRAIALAQARGLPLALEQFFRSSSLCEIAKTAADSMVDLREWTSKTLVPLNWPSTKSPAAMPTLFFFHDAVGTVWKLLELARHLPYPVIGVQAAAFLGDNIQSTKAPPSNVKELAKTYWDIIRERQSQGPYAFGGFSFGCRVAHEVARLAVHHGHTILPLLLFDGLPFEMPSAQQQMTKVQKAAAAQIQIDEYVTEAFSDSLVRSLGINYRKFCWMEDTYESYTDAEMETTCSKSDPSIWLHADLYMTQHWKADVSKYRSLGIDITIVAIIPDCTHLTILRHPAVSLISRHIRHRTKLAWRNLYRQEPLNDE
ncbi:unnamed protein product [Peronospora destructor]|uniref:Carrier domain-containing protein n=1 Tax=Peronospora destructor TaxID=86335 RepID=A0AAV0V7D2_9STRA|nr:unnamed protein product [Peronospora destructor]